MATNTQLTKALKGRTVDFVRQRETELDIDLTDGLTLSIKLAAGAGTVTLTSSDDKTEYSVVGPQSSSAPPDEVVPGIYEHYKGRKYLVLGTAAHSKTAERLVVYIPLGLFARPAPLGLPARDVR